MLRFVNTPALLGALSYACLAGIATAQEGQRIVTGKVRSERLDDKFVPATGGRLVGVQWGLQPRRPFQVDGFAVDLPAASRGETFCMILGSRDGAYAGVVDFGSAGGKPGSARLEFVSRYASQLRRFDASAVAVLLLRAATCDEVTEGPIAPLIAEADARGRRLVAFVSAGDAALRARLFAHGGKIIEEGKCTLIAEGSRVRHSHVCTIQLNGPVDAGPAMLAIETREIGGRPHTERYELLLSSP